LHRLIWLSLSCRLVMGNDLRVPAFRRPFDMVSLQLCLLYLILCTKIIAAVYLALVLRFCFFCVHASYLSRFLPNPARKVSTCTPSTLTEGFRCSTEYLKAKSVMH
jgi:hypothetical protein